MTADDLEKARELIETPWIENECPRCGCALTCRDGMEPIGPCDHCRERMLRDALDALAASERERERTRDALRRCANAFEDADAAAANAYLCGPCDLEGDAVNLQAERDELRKHLDATERLFRGTKAMFDATLERAHEAEAERDALRAERDMLRTRDVASRTTLTSDEYVALIHAIQERYELRDDQVMSALAGILMAKCQKHGISVEEYIARCVDMAERS